MFSNPIKFLIALALFLLTPSLALGGPVKYVFSQGYLIDMQGAKTGYVLIYGHDNCMKNRFGYGSKVMTQPNGNVVILNGQSRIPMGKPRQVIKNPRAYKCGESEIVLDDLPEVPQSAGSGEIEGMMARGISD